MNWFPLYLLAVVILWGVSSPRDRNALRILLVAAVGSFLLMWAFRPIIAPWKLVLPASVEVLTVLAMLKWAKNPNGYLQTGLLGIAWLTHVLCFWDLMANTSLVYDDYESILACVAVCQLLACYDTLVFNVRRLGAFLASSAWGVRLPRTDAGILPHSGD